MRSEKGFTLVEIMIVVAIIAIAATFAFSNLLSWNRHNQFVGFQREVFTELQECRSRAFSMRRQYRLAIDLDAETVVMEQGNAGTGSTAWTADRLTISAPGNSGVTDIAYLLGASGATVNSGTFYLVFNPGGDVYRLASGVVTPIDTANIHLSDGAGATATVQLFCWTGKARLSDGTI